MYELEGNLFDINIPQIVGGNQYPAGWFSDADARAKFGIERIVDVAPDYNQATQVAIPILPIQIDGVWTQQWQIVDLSADELKAQVRAKIVEIEQEHPITARNLRELGLVVAELVHAVTGSYPTGPAYQQARDLDAIIAALRAQL